MISQLSVGDRRSRYTEELYPEEVERKGSSASVKRRIRCLGLEKLCKKVIATEKQWGAIEEFIETISEAATDSLLSSFQCRKFLCVVTQRGWGRPLYGGELAARCRGSQEGLHLRTVV